MFKTPALKMTLEVYGNDINSLKTTINQLAQRPLSSIREHDEQAYSDGTCFKYQVVKVEPSDWINSQDLFQVR